MKNLHRLLLSLLAAPVLLGSTGSYAQTYTFTCPTTTTTWTVPAGVTSIMVDVQGAAGGLAGPIGGASPIPALQSPGKGGRVLATLAVVPGQVLNIYVGDIGGTGSTTGSTGGFNGGGNAAGHVAAYSGGGGGGASDIRIGGTALTNRVVVGAGGGGAGYNGSCLSGGPQDGGDGGGLTGASVTTCDGDLSASGYTTVVHATGGTPVAGGTGGALCCVAPYTTGGTGVSGNGGGALAPDPGIGGGGGGGYFGGGGGCWMGGGGGSSYADATIATGVTHSAGVNTGCGIVVICNNSPGTISGPGSVCAGNSITLTESVAGGTWSVSSGATITAAGVLTGVTPGMVTVTYSKGSACGTQTTTSSVFVTTAPTPITGTTVLCIGSTTALASTPAGGTWSSAVPSVASVSPTGVVSGITAGTSTVIYSVAGGCFKSVVINVRGIVGRSSVCKDSSITLAVPGGGGTWESGNTTVAVIGSSTGIVTGMLVGTSVITYSGTGCTLLKTITVGAYAPIAGRDSVCVGGSGYLTNIVGGGTWSSSATTIASVSSDSGLVYGYVAGIVTINYRLPAGCWASTSLRVIDNPPPIGGTLQMCPDATTLLSDAVTGGTWSSANNSIATVTAGTGIVRGISADTTTIYYTIQPGCRTGITVTVNPLPAVITANRDIECPGVMDTLHTASRGGTWGSTTASIATVDTGGVITTLTGGVATFNYTLPTGCLRTMTLTVRPGPVPVVTYNWLYNTFYTPDIYPSYQWYDSAQGLIPGATSPSLAALENEYYWVVVTDENGCKGPSSRIYFNTHMLGVSHVQQAAVKVYPNPATETVSIECAVRVKAVLSTIDGRMLIQQADAKSLDVSRLASGVYMLAVYDDSGEILTVQKIIRE